MPVTNRSLKLPLLSVTPPMCSSPAYPTSALLGGPITGDRTAIDAPFTTRSEDVIDISSKGLLPQLIDVLHRLTEGQELLSGKIRDARLEYTCHSDPVRRDVPQLSLLPLPTRVPLWVPAPMVPSEFTGIPQSDRCRVGCETDVVNGSGNASLPETLGAPAPPASATVQVERPTNPPAGIVTHAGTPADPSSEISTLVPKGLNSAPPGRQTTTPLNRDYNFFDELDARLV